MASEQKFLAFDLGAESGRAVMGLLGGGKLRLADVHRFANGGVSIGDSMYWDVLRLFDEMKRGLRLAVEAHGKGIAGLGVDTWGVDFALLGPNDVLLENPHCYRDSRIDGMMAEAEKIVPPSEIYEQTGIQFMPINTLYHMLAITRSNRWMLETARTMLMMADLFNFFFTGEKACEFTNATTTQFYNPRAGDWARSLLERLEIPSHFLPDICQPGTVLGKVTASIAEETGAGQIPVIAPATHDTGSAVAAVPAVGRGHVYISSGTWSLMGVESKEPIVNEKALELNFTNEGGVENTFRVLRNIMGLWLVQESRRTWAQSGRDYSYSELTEMAEAAEPFRAIIDPDDPVFLKPGDMPARIREFCRQTNQPIPEDEGAVVRTALDSLALKYRWVLERLEMLMESRLEPIHIVGGGSRNRLLSQLTANVAGRQVVAGPVEATAIGNLLVQAIALGQIGSLEEAREIVRKSFDVLTYDPRPDSRIEDAYSKLEALMGG
ncbi:MAG TPA: rhamnulokinase family protein [Armatimonadota bacterium]|nr:rhamnulokinase family protein [Armatimonadota bacterium]